MNITDKIDNYLNEKKELIVMWDEAQEMIDKMKKGKVFPKKEKRINKTLVELATEAEKVMAKRDIKKMRNWLKKINSRNQELKNYDDKTAYRHLYVKLSDPIRERQQSDWEAEGYEF